MGGRPTHPELLDWLAADFVQSGWDIKRMHKLIVMSNAYRQSSAYSGEAAKADPREKLLWRFPRERLEGEVIRDSALAVAGLLNEKIGGPERVPGTSGGSRQAARGMEREYRSQRAEPAQRLHLRSTERALSDARSVRHAGYARILRTPQSDHHRTAGDVAVERQTQLWNGRRPLQGAF